MPRIVNGWFPITRIITDGFINPGIISDWLFLPRIIVCVCGLRRLNPWLRKSRGSAAALGFEFCCVVVVWFGDAC